MNRQENIFIAKRMLVDNIYRSAKLEGLVVTYSQVLDVVQNIATDLKPNEVNDILNLKNAWKYILENLDVDLDLGLIKNCHSIIGKGMEIPFNEIGEFRTSGVGIGGTTWRPEEPNINKLHNELMEIKKIENIEERSIKVFCFIMRSQMFRDGNKRVANLVSNFELIKNGAGIISIPEDKINEFKKILIEFYETNNINNIYKFIIEKCFYNDMEFLSKEDKRNSSN